MLGRWKDPLPSQGNLSLVGRQTNEQRTEAPQEGFSEVRAKGKENAEEGKAESACTLKKGDRGGEEGNSQ